MGEQTYDDAVRHFDHRELAELPTYLRLRQAIDDFREELEKAGSDLETLRQFVDVVQDLAVTMPFADMCQECEGDPGDGVALQG